MPMGVSCQKCGAELQEDQAFCPRCGAVIGAEPVAPRPDADPSEFAATMVGQSFTVPPPSRAADVPPSPPSTAGTKAPNGSTASNAGGHEAGEAPRRYSSLTLALIGFVVAIIGVGFLVAVAYLLLAR